MLVMQGLERVREHTYQAWVDRALGGVASRPEVRVLRPADLPAAAAAPQALAPPASSGLPLIAPRFDPLPEPHLTATSVSELLSCPRRFYYGSLLGVPERTRLPEAVIASAERAPAPSPALPAFVRGRLLHRMLQHLVPRASGAEEVEQLARRFARDEGVDDARAIAQVAATASSALEQFARTAPGRELKQARAVFVERSFELELAGARLRGQIDLLIHARDGRHLVVDYKTDAEVTSEAEALALAKSMGYRDQLLFYALAVQQLARSDTIEAHLFFTQPGVTIRGADTSPLMLSVFRNRLSALLARAREGGVDAAYPFTEDPATCETCGFRARRICAKWSSDDEQ